MASQAALELVMRLRDEATSKLKGSAGMLGNVLGGLGKIGAIGLGGAVAGVTALGGAVAKMTADAMRLPDIERRFENLAISIGETSESMIGPLREAVQGTASDMDLMLQSSRLMSMGLAGSNEEAAKLAQIAYQLGDPTQDLATNFENLALTLANQSLPRLDSMGISAGKVRERIAELQEETEGLSREQAFMTAVMEQAEEAMKKVGDKEVDLSVMTQQMRAQWKNVTNEIGSAFLPVAMQVAELVLPLISEGMASLAPLAQGVADVLTNVVKYLQFTVEEGDSLNDFLANVPEAIRPVVKWLGDLALWLGENVPTAIGALVDFWQGSLQPVLRVFWEFIQRNIIPILRELIQWIGTNLPIAIGKLVELWQGTLYPALHSVWEFIDEKIIPVFRRLSDAVGGISGIIATVQNAISGFSSALSNLVNALPDWLTPGSATPLEEGLEGIARVLEIISNIHIPTFGMQLQGLGDILDEVGRVMEYINAMFGVQRSGGLVIVQLPFDTLVQPIVEWFEQLATGLGQVHDVLQGAGGIFAALAQEIPAATVDLRTVFKRIEDLVDEINVIFRVIRGGGLVIFIDPFELIAEPIVTWIEQMGEGLAAISSVLDPFMNIAKVLAGEIPEANIAVSDVFSRLDELFGSIEDYYYEMAQTWENVEDISIPEPMLNWLRNLAEATGPVKTVITDAVGALKALGDEIKPLDAGKLVQLLNEMRIAIGHVMTTFTDVTLDTERLGEIRDATQAVRGVVDSIHGLAKIIKDTMPPDTSRVQVLVNGIAALIPMLQGLPTVDEAVKTSWENLAAALSAASAALVSIGEVGWGPSGDISDAIGKARDRIQEMVTAMSEVDWTVPAIDFVGEFTAALMEGITNTMRNVRNMLDPAYTGSLAWQVAGASWASMGHTLANTFMDGMQQGFSARTLTIHVTVVPELAGGGGAEF